MLVSELVKLVQEGAVIRVDAGNYHSSELQKLAKISGEKGVKLQIYNANEKLFSELKAIAVAGEGHVLFEF